MDYTHTVKSPVGLLTLAGDGDNLTGLWVEGQKHFGVTLKPGHMEHRLPVFRKAEEWLERYFAGENPAIDFSLAPFGSPFRQAVWDILLKIPYGQVITYGDIARQLMAPGGRPSSSARAVGGAVGHNPISIIIPCHRVVGTGGNLTGYAGGLRVKTTLLTLEKADMDDFYIPSKGTAL
mgnify:CR=1 FL=1|jgi:methylated-DNA-[protein]-cysteine S-methyltransferase